MRPAHCAREVEHPSGGFRINPRHFNEARALCAGSCPRIPQPLGAKPYFNEARALCAGSCAITVPELISFQYFNEARALCAGSYRPRGCAWVG